MRVYIAQLFLLDPAIQDAELDALHIAFRLPPKTFAKADLLAMAEWSPSVAPFSMTASAAAALWRTAHLATGPWEEALLLRRKWVSSIWRAADG